MVECHTYGYFEAWAQWLWVGSVQNGCLWEVRILWWARLGKIAAALAGMVIIVDILGEERLQRFGIKVVSRFGTLSITMANVLLLFGSTAIGIPFALFWFVLREISRKAEINGFYGPEILFIILQPAIGVVALICGLVAIPAFATLALIGTSHVLAYPRVGTLLRSTSLVLFVIGFHFDLLGS